jgi:hypothetical protein
MGRRIFGSFGGLALVPLLAAAPVFAEPTAEAVKMARKRFQEGVQAIDGGRYEAARVAFQQAYALKPHPSVLRNLGEAELRTGHYLEAARHLATFVRDTTYGSASERDSASKSLARAEAHVGSLVIQVDVDGAEIAVDGEIAGRSPVSDPFYTEPGERVIRIRKEGYETYEKTLPIQAARTTHLNIRLDTTPVATPAASVSRAAGSLTPSAEGVEAGGVEPPPAGLVPEPDSKIGARTIVLVTSGGLALISAGVWLGFGLRGASLESDADDLRRQVNALHPVTGCDRDEPPCPELRDVNDRRAAANTVALAGAVATGVSVAAFGATLFFWPKAERRGTGAALIPVVGRDRAGVELSGAF